MTDAWVAECLPCKWETDHDSQLGAITAATDHVFDRHRQTSAAERAALKVGHVQLRTLDSPSVAAGKKQDEPPERYDRQKDQEPLPEPPHVPTPPPEPPEEPAEEHHKHRKG